MKAIYFGENHDNIQRVYEEYMPKPIYNKDELLSKPEKFRDTQYIFSTWGMPKMTEEEIRTCLPSLKAVFYAAGSVQFFARPFLNCGVKIFSAWAANAVPVAEYTTAQIVLANAGFFRTAPIASSGQYEIARTEFAHYPGNYSVRVGIIGAGMVGKMVIKRLKHYDLEVVTFDPFLSDEIAADLQVTKVSLQELFSTCQIVTNHLADNDQTKNILNGQLFSQMLPYATFLNTGRGAQVVEKDLITVLKARPDLTAILDVTDPEPPVPNSELHRLPNCILTPHIAGSSGNEVRRMAKYMMEEYNLFIADKPCRYEVTESMLTRMA